MAQVHASVRHGNPVLSRSTSMCAFKVRSLLLRAHIYTHITLDFNSTIASPEHSYGMLLLQAGGSCSLGTLTDGVPCRTQCPWDQNIAG